MAWPEDMTSPSPEATLIAKKPPSAALGYLLNVLLPGAGFTYIDRWGWHMGWLGILTVLTIGSPVLFSLDSPLSLLLLLTGFLAMLFHFSQVHAQQRDRGFQPPLELAVKLVLILAQGFMALAFVSIFVLILLSTS